MMCHAMAEAARTMGRMGLMGRMGKGRKPNWRNEISELSDPVISRHVFHDANFGYAGYIGQSA
jgi:hypothetical protein